MVGLLNKDFKTSDLKMLKKIQVDVVKVKKTMYEQYGNINKEIENLKRTQKEILELKSTIIETKNVLEIQGHI